MVIINKLYMYMEKIVNCFYNEECCLQQQGPFYPLFLVTLKMEGRWTVKGK